MKTRNTHEISVKAGATVSRRFMEKWQHKRAACVATLREPASVGFTARLHEVPETAVRHWQQQEGIPPYNGPKRPMPEVGQILA
jgi:hypothetical protein